MAMKKIVKSMGLKCMMPIMLTLICSCCGWRTWDMSKEQELSSYPGTNYSLKIPMTLREQRKHQYRFVSHAIMPLQYAHSMGRLICDLPVGTKVDIISVKMIAIEGYRSLYLIGTLKNPETAESVEFEILLGAYYSESKKLWLQRMPWEAPSQPEERYVVLDKPLLWSDRLP